VGRRADAKFGGGAAERGLVLLPRGGDVTDRAYRVCGSGWRLRLGCGLPVRKAGFSLAFKAVI
jgi:hypothetical protein